jgi:hypothetical protein
MSRIREEGLTRSQVMDTAFWLTDRYGPRLNGSPEFEEAGEWAVERLRAWGIRSVRKERFASGPGWSLTGFHATMTSPRVMPIIGMPRAWTPGTPGTVSAEVVRPVIANEQDAAHYRGRLRGKIVLVQAPRAVRMLDRGDGLVLRYDDDNGRWREEALSSAGASAPPAVRIAPPARPPFALGRFYRDEGVLALFDRGPDDDLVPGGSNLSWMTQRVDGGTLVVEGASPFANPTDVLPQVTLAVEHYNRLARLVDHGVPVRVELNVAARFSAATVPRGFNIVGEIPGTDKAGEIVLIGAHFDSWHGGTGATDNAAGCAAMMEAMRILAAAGVQPRRTIRLGLWGNEEGFATGAEAYAALHLGTRQQPAPELARTSIYLNLDNGTGRIRGVWMQGRPGVAPIFEAWADPLRDLGVDLLSPRGVSQTDHVTFDDLGIPSFQFVQERYEYNARTHHTTMDVYDRLQPEDLKQMAVVVAVFAWQAATRGDLMPRARAGE